MGKRIHKKTLFRSVFWGGVLLLVISLSFPLSSEGAILGFAKKPEPYVVPKGEVLSDDAYIAAREITVFGGVNGDISALSERFTYKGETVTDILAAAPYIVISGFVSDDARLVGASVVIDGEVKGDTALVGQMVTIDRDATIDGDVLILADEAYVSGSLGADVKIVANTVRFSGAAAGSVFVHSPDIVFESPARVSGDVSWSGRAAPIVEDGVEIFGTFKESTLWSEWKNKQEDRSFFRTSGIFRAVSILFLLLVVGFLFPKTIRAYIKESENARILLRHGLRGLIVFFALLLGGVVLLISLIGMLAGIILLALFCLFILTALAGSVLLLGRSTMALFIKDEQQEEPLWRIAVVGVIVSLLLSFIPIVGNVVLLFFFFAAFGIVSRSFYRILRGDREEEMKSIA